MTPRRFKLSMPVRALVVMTSSLIAIYLVLWCIVGLLLWQSEPIQGYRLAVILNPHSAYTHLQLGNAWFKNRFTDPDLSYQSAISEYETSIRLIPDNANAHFKFADLLFDIGREADAFHEYSEAVRLAPRDSALHFLYGRALLKAGHESEARREYGIALDLNSNIVYDVDAR